MASRTTRPEPLDDWETVRCHILFTLKRRLTFRLLVLRLTLEPMNRPTLTCNGTPSYGRMREYFLLDCYFTFFIFQRR